MVPPACRKAWQPLGEGDGNLRTPGGTEEGIALAEQIPFDPGKIDGHYLARIRTGESHVSFLVALVGEVSQEQTLTRHHPFGRAPELAHHPGIRAVTEAGGEVHALGQVHHHAGLGDHGFTRVERHVHELHGLAMNCIGEIIRHVCFSFFDRLPFLPGPCSDSSRIRPNRASNLRKLNGHGHVWI